VTEPRSTDGPAYPAHLERLERVWWKRLFNVQQPYRLHLKSLRPGYTLDLGCGIGRNLIHLGGRGHAVGVDKNKDAVRRCTQRGLEAYEPQDFFSSQRAIPQSFDTLLCAHVIEHLPADTSRALIARYLPFLKPNGRVVLIVPQEAGQDNDTTHINFLNLAALNRLALQLGLETVRAYSFPFPRPFGHLFVHNESVVIARKAEPSS